MWNPAFLLWTTMKPLAKLRRYSNCSALNLQCFQMPYWSVQLVEGLMMLWILIQFSWDYTWLCRHYQPNWDSDIGVLFCRLMPPNQLTKSLIQFNLCLIASTMWYLTLSLPTSPWLLPPISSPFTFFPSDGWQNVKHLVYLLQLGSLWCFSPPCRN